MNQLKTLIALILITGFGVAKAQEGATSASASYPTIENKIKKSEKDLVNPKKNVNAKFWLSRASVMMDAYNVNLQYLQKGAQQLYVSFQFGTAIEKRTEEREGKLYEIEVYDRVTLTYLNAVLDSYEETKPLHNNPLPLASEALKKADELDADQKLTKKIKDAYKKLAELYKREGIEKFLAEDFKSAFENFEGSVLIGQNPLLEGAVDTAVIFNAGMAASRAELEEESIKYYEMALSYNYPEPSLYIFLEKMYMAQGDTAKGVEMLSTGFKKHSDNQDIVRELINYYLQAGKAKEALDYIKIAQENDPTNVSLYFAEATLYDKQGETDKAIETYKRCIEIDPQYYNSYYNLGVVYYNRAQKYYKEASDAPDNEYKALMEKGDIEFKNSIDPMLECGELIEALEEKTEDEETTLKTVYETLKSVYYRLKMDAEYDAVKAKLE